MCKVKDELERLIEKLEEDGEYADIEQELDEWLKGETHEP